MSDVVERFMRYVQVFSTSDPANEEQVPSSACQHDMARLMGEELVALGCENVTLDEHAYVTATFPASAGAEAAPTLDVDGFDTLHKAAILAALAHGFAPDVHALPVQGIRGVVSAEDIAQARELGYRIKLLAIVKDAPDGLELRVAPTLVPADGMLGSVSGVFNAAMVKSDLDDWTLYYGRGVIKRALRRSPAAAPAASRRPRP